MPLIVHYPLNDNAASTAVGDASGNGLHGTAARNTNLTYAVGRVGGAWNGNGTSDCVLAAALSQLAIGSPWSICGWVNATATSATQVILNNNIDANNTVAIQIYLDLLRATIHNGTTAIGKSGAAVAGTWQHFAFTNTGAGGSAATILYLDGVVQVGASNATATLNAGLAIGRRSYTSSSMYLAGLLDDLRIDDAVLTPQQIGAIIADRRGRAYPWQPTIIQPIIERITQPFLQGV